ncbi:PepSY domain-containing protein [Arthrobacter sp. Hz1]
MNATPSNKKKMLVGSLAGIALIGGTAAVGLTAANAATVAPTPPVQASQDGNEADEKQEPKLNGSITAPESATEQSEADESAQLAKLATIDAKAAEAAATGSAPGSSVVSTELGDENGSVVYEVTVKDGAGVLTEVEVDAGNATVLATEAGEDEASEETEDESGEAGESAEDESGETGETADDQTGADNEADGEQDDAQEAASAETN